MLENLIIFFVSLIVGILYIRGHIIRPYYYYKYSDDYYINGRWLRPAEAINIKDEYGVKVNDIRYSFIKHPGRGQDKFWYSSPPIFFMDLNEHPTEKVDMVKLKLFYLIMSYISLVLATTTIIVVVFIMLKYPSSNKLAAALIATALFMYWFMLKFTYFRKEKYIKRDFTVSIKSYYHKKMSSIILIYLLGDILCLILLQLGLA